MKVRITDFTIDIREKLELDFYSVDDVLTMCRMERGHHGRKVGQVKFEDTGTEGIHPAITQAIDSRKKGRHVLKGIDLAFVMVDDLVAV